MTSANDCLNSKKKKEYTECFILFCPSSGSHRAAAFTFSLKAEQAIQIKPFQGS